MTSSPWLPLLLAAPAVYLFKLWWSDYRAEQAGTPKPGAFPGTTPASRPWLLIAAAGGLLLVAVETAGEYALGVVGEQTTVSAIALLGFIAAGFYEELFFRGFIFYDRRGRGWRNLSIIAASLLFTLLHYQYYLDPPEAGGRAIAFSVKSAWSLTMIFLSSLWFYFLRFSAHNVSRSLLPCFVAHIVSNVAVFAVKGAQGFVTSWW